MLTCPRNLYPRKPCKKWLYGGIYIISLMIAQKMTVTTFYSLYEVPTTNDQQFQEKNITIFQFQFKAMLWHIRHGGVNVMKI